MCPYFAQEERREVQAVHAVELRGRSGVEEGAAEALCALLIERREGQGLLPCAGAELREALRVHIARVDGRRGNDEDVRALFRPTGRVLSAADDVFHARADALRRRAVPLLGVVRAQHEDEQVHRLVAHQAGLDIARAGPAAAVRVLKHRGAAVEALLYHKVLLSQRLLQQHRPAGGLRIAHRAAGLGHAVKVGGVAAVAVGIGVAEADDVFSVHISLSPAGTRRRRTGPRGGTSRPAGTGRSSPRAPGTRPRGRPCTARARGRRPCRT